MKKLSLLLILVLSTVLMTNAQDIGKFWVGGSVGFSSEKEKGDNARLNDFRIVPEVGYILSDKVGIGLSIGYRHNEFGGTVYENDSYYNTKSRATGFSVSPFVRYTFLKGNIGGLFADGGFGYTQWKEKHVDGKYTAWDIGIRPGVAFNISDKIILTGKFGFFGYQQTKDKLNYTGDVKKTDVFKFDLDLSQILLGMNIVF